MLLSVSNLQRLAAERVFEGSAMGTAIRANDTTDVWALRPRAGETQTIATVNNADMIIMQKALQAFCKKLVKTNYHPVGTARMLRDGDPMAVLDLRLRVRGVEGLRVIDCSAMPFIPSGNTNAAAIAMGDRAVALIRDEAPRSTSAKPASE